MVVVRSWLNCCIWSVGDRAYPFRMNKLTFGLCYARFMVVRVVFYACGGNFSIAALLSYSVALGALIFRRGIVIQQNFPVA